MVVPAGWSGDQTNTLTPCKAGYYSDDKSQTCTQCQPGEVCTHRTNEPLPCNEGHESTSAGLETCVPCLEGEVFDEVNLICIDISAGYGSLHPMLAEEKCPYGTYSTTGGAGTIQNSILTDFQPGDPGFAISGAGS